MKRRVLRFLASIMLCSIPISGGLISVGAVAKEKSLATTEVSFASPEEAVEYISSSLAEADLSALLPAFGIERQVADYSFVGMSERLRAIVLETGVPPVRFQFYADTARIQFTNEAATQLRNLAYSLLVTSGTPLDSLIGFSEGMSQYATDLEMVLDPARLANLKVLQMADPSSVFDTPASLERHRKNILAQLAVTGGDDMQERLVLYELDGRTYQGGFTLVRYGDRWQVRGLHSSLGGTSLSGHAVPMTIDEFNRGAQ